MCRNIRDLHNFKPPATDEEIRASSLQFVRKPQAERCHPAVQGQRRGLQPGRRGGRRRGAGADRLVDHHGAAT